ncbi:unnamed protein product [Effrenium voratum]|uniref:Uncharacterized protein n=1 Tax=Effrenium voratum TaxID=2562239 RepID=A0AA36J9B8_9DINO|nr:unnamed protein product [Effrenium voratum]
MAFGPRARERALETGADVAKQIQVKLTRGEVEHQLPSRNRSIKKMEKKYKMGRETARLAFQAMQARLSMAGAMVTWFGSDAIVQATSAMQPIPEEGPVAPPTPPSPRQLGGRPLAVKDDFDAAAQLATEVREALEAKKHQTSKELFTQKALKKRFKCGSKIAATVQRIAKARLSMAGFKAVPQATRNRFEYEAASAASAPSNAPAKRRSRPKLRLRVKQEVKQEELSPTSRTAPKRRLQPVQAVQKVKVKKEPQVPFQGKKKHSRQEASGPCACAGCPYQVTWHRSHCCNRCAKGIGHGKWCDRRKEDDVIPPPELPEELEKMHQEEAVSAGRPRWRQGVLRPKGPSASTRKSWGLRKWLPWLWWRSGRRSERLSHRGRGRRLTVATGESSVERPCLLVVEVPGWLMRLLLFQPEISWTVAACSRACSRQLLADAAQLCAELRPASQSLARRSSALIGS